ncbi:MAG: hypothetical protein A2Y38_24305 [Spirochaetes bacterium GWB1_59_5]|nr:MAG: hypothetical protein A2Y38_24305 [Spirochaetes bacterium GWB1_59_5]
MQPLFGLRTEELDIIRGILETAGPELERVAVFGSRAQGNYRPNSDLDLVLYGPLDEKSADRLWTLFQESPLPFSVDVKRYSAIVYLPLRQHIDQVAKPLFVHSAEGWVAEHDPDAAGAYHD